VIVIMVSILAVMTSTPLCRAQGSDVEVRIVGLREKVPEEHMRLGIYADGSFRDLHGHEINLDNAFKRVFGDNGGGKEPKVVNILVHVTDPKDTSTQILMESIGTMARMVPKDRKVRVFVRSQDYAK
jgi:hypothetical protein